MAEPLRVVSWLWKPRAMPPYFEPPTPAKYGPEHVHTLRNMLARHLHMDYEFCCITDDQTGLDPDIRVIPLWDKGMEYGGCYNRLYAFSEDMREIIGPRFVWIDLDVVIVDDITPLFRRTESIILNSYKRGPRDPDQYYNGAMVMMDAGARKQVWETWRGEESIRQVEEGRRKGVCTLTDQGWMRLVLGKTEARWRGEQDGIYEALWIGGRLPPNARMVFFSGPRDPTAWMHVPWVREHYR